MKSSASKRNQASSPFDRLPKGHISWSQIDLLERSAMDYVSSYIRKQPRYESEAMMFGKRFATAMETGDTGDENSTFTFLVRIGVPRLPLAEHRLETAYKGIKMVGILDTTQQDLSRFREYKTGQSEWTQAKVDAHGQLTYYAALIYLTTGKLPEEACLDWIRTKYGDQGELEATGDIMTFRRKPFTLLEVSAMLQRTERAARTILELVDQYGGTTQPL